MPIVQLRKIKTSDNITQKSTVYQTNQITNDAALVEMRSFKGEMVFLGTEATVSKGVKATQGHSPLSSETIFLRS